MCSAIFSPYRSWVISRSDSLPSPSKSVRPHPSLEKTPYEGPKMNNAMTTQPDCSLIKEMSKNSTQKYKNHESRKRITV